jgi:prepilin-type N-terminal cleavage/methylation domain-containing protein
MHRHEKTIPAQIRNFNSSGWIYRERAIFGTRRILSEQAHQAGFTLVEVMVAVVILAVGLSAIAGMQTSSIQQATNSDQMSMRVNAITHRAEALSDMPVRDETLGLDGAMQIDVTTSGIFEEENMCEYSKDCGWSYVDYEDTSAHTVRQRVIQGYPLPNLVMIELEAAPQHVSESEAKRRTVRLTYVRSTRFN